jgi:metallo-beta-lactamase family protein
LVEGAQSVRIYGNEIPVRAKVHTVGGLSAHAGQRALINWYDKFRERPPLVLVHGEPEAQEALCNIIDKELAVKAHIAAEGEIYDLAKPMPY